MMLTICNYFIFLLLKRMPAPARMTAEIIVMMLQKKGILLSPVWGEAVRVALLDGDTVVSLSS